MDNKPPSRDGYSSDQLALVASTCLYVFTKLGDLLDDVVVIGGLSPYLLVDQDELPMGLEPHVGTMDLDLGLSLAVFDEERYQSLTARLREAGFGPAINPNGRRRLQTWTTGSDRPATIDFLIPSQAESDQLGGICHIEADFGAFITEGLDLSFRDRRLVTQSGHTLLDERATRTIPVCGPGAFTVLKALAFGSRAANKDAYDMSYVWSGLGIDEVARCLQLLLPDARVEKALAIIRNEFTAHDATGPRRVAQFLTNGSDDDIQADVSGNAVALLRAIERLGDRI